MHAHSSIILAGLVLSHLSYGAPNAAPRSLDGPSLLRRALHAARAPQYDEYVPFKIDEEYCLWMPKGDCYMNKAFDYLWEYMKYDPPKYDDYDWYKAQYKSDEGVYASGKGALGEYEENLIYLYDTINKHAGYDKYDYDYEDYIDNAADKYCVWWYEGKCWTNDVVKYIDGIWNKTDPYKKREVKRQDKGDWSVYSTSTGVQSWYATACWDLMVAINKYGPLKYEWESDDYED